MMLVMATVLLSLHMRVEVKQVMMIAMRTRRTLNP